MGSSTSTPHHGRVATHRESDAGRRAEASVLDKAIATAGKGHGAEFGGHWVDRAELVAMCKLPYVAETLAHIHGEERGEHTADELAHMLLTRYDTDYTGRLNAEQVQRMRKELAALGSSPFYVFVETGDAVPGSTVRGVVVMHLDEPLTASSVNVTLAADMTVMYEVPQTQMVVADLANTYTAFVPREKTVKYMSSTVELHSGEGPWLQPGTHRWPFSFIVPLDAKPSFQIEGMGTCEDGNGMASLGRVALTYTVTAFTQAVENADTCATLMAARAVDPLEMLYRVDNYAKRSTSTTLQVKARPPAVAAKGTPMPDGCALEDRCILSSDQACVCGECLPPGTEQVMEFTTKVVPSEHPTWLDEGMVLPGKSTLTGEVSIVQHAGVQVKGWHGQMGARTKMLLTIDGTVWKGCSTACRTIARGGTVGPHTVNTLQLGLFYHGGLAEIDTPTAVLRPEVVLAVSCKCPTQCRAVDNTVRFAVPVVPFAARRVAAVRRNHDVSGTVVNSRAGAGGSGAGASVGASAGSGGGDVNDGDGGIFLWTATPTATPRFGVTGHNHAKLATQTRACDGVPTKQHNEVDDMHVVQDSDL